MQEPKPDPAAQVRGGVVVPAASWLGRGVALSVILALGFGLIVPKIAGAAFLLLSLVAVIWLEPLLFHGAWRMRAEERLLAIAVAGFVAVWLLAWCLNGLDAAGLGDAGRILRLLLIVPLTLLLARVEGLDRAWWTGLTIGSIGAGLYAIGYALGEQSGEWAERVGGSTNPIYFGGLSYAFALMLLPRAADRRLGRWARVAAGAGVGLGLAASALSGSRGALLTLPPLLVIYVLFMAPSVHGLRRLAAPAAVLALVVGLSFAPGVPFGERLMDAWASMHSRDAVLDLEDTLAVRWALWKVSAAAIVEHPWLGGGPGLFRTALEQAVAAGQAEPVLLRYHHPHNQYLSALLLAGPVGLLALLALFSVPLLQTWRAMLAASEYRGRHLAWSALTGVLVMLALAVGESIFQRNAGVVWFAILVATGLAVARPALHHVPR
ncbi:MAG: hypothetical protein Kow0020_09340 [Wenzhouxiangellaceae bacterium]